VGHFRASLNTFNFLPLDSHQKRLFLLRLFLGITLVLGILAVIDQRRYADEIAVWAVSPYWRWGLRGGALLVGILGLLLLSSWTSMKSKWFSLIEGGGDITARLGILRPILAAIIAFAFPLLIMGHYGRFVLPFFTRLLIFWVIVSIGSWLAFSIRSDENPIMVFSAIGLIYGAVHRLAVFIADLSTYPFSLGWSEASRYYYASLYFSERIYGEFIPPSVLHPTRYLMQSLAFLLPGAGISVHRAWQVAIWVLFSALVGIALSKRLNLTGPWFRLLFILWTFLFLFQGPVYYHLLVMVVLVLWGTSLTRVGWTLLIVVVASIWAGISRINWIPVPGMLAALIYFLERTPGKKSHVQYLRWPIIWFVVGSVTGFISQFLYVAISGNAPTSFGSSFTSQLLWYRLLPSATYPLGVLPAILLASLPFLLLLLSRRRREIDLTAPIRLVSISLILIILFIGGILVSVKIGGGSNLHNLDAFLVALMVAGAYLATGNWQLDYSTGGGHSSNSPAIVVCGIVMPILFVIGSGLPLRSYDPEQAQRSIAAIQSIVDPINAEGGEILFISQRHLLTFDQIHGVDMIPEYETVFLMEMAMSRNRAYLDKFHDELEHHRFDLIIVDRLSTQLQGSEHDFAEENNAWVEEVSNPILCYYEEIATLSKPPLQFLIPAKGGDHYSF